MSYAAPYKGLKIIDVSQGIAGPYCSMLLAQHGADVIKVETLGEGDWARSLGTRYGDHTAFSIIGNLGKRSVTLDLKVEAGKAVLWRLIEAADVFLEGFRPGVIERLGFGWEAVHARAPRLIYLSISGFGQTGPLSGRPAMDPVLQAYTGMVMENCTADGTPHRLPVIVADMSAALYAFQAVSAGLYARRDESLGRRYDISLMQATAALQSVRLMQSHLEGGAVRPSAVPQGVFRTRDGWIILLTVQNRDWAKLCAVLDLAQLPADPRFAEPGSRFANQEALYDILRPRIASCGSEQLAARLADAQIMHERINDYAAYLAQPHVQATESIQWLAQPGSESPVPVTTVPGIAPLRSGEPNAVSPVRGQHTGQVLAEHGFTAAQIEALRADGVIASS